MYLFEDHFDLETIRDNFDFYEPKTVHESSLSPCVHVILAAKIGNLAKAYELYLRTSRLDLDDYNHEADEGLHITSMAGTWMAVVEGMAGVRVRESGLEINPTIPEAWQSYTFRILYQTVPLEISIDKSNVSIKNMGNKPVTCLVKKEMITIRAGEVHVTKV